jgi:hypothetical protein
VAKVTGIRKRPKILPDGRFVEVYEVSFVSDKGISGTVDIEETQFTPEGARKKALEMAKQLDAVVD